MREEAQKLGLPDHERDLEWVDAALWHARRTGAFRAEACLRLLRAEVLEEMSRNGYDPDEGPALRIVG